MTMLKDIKGVGDKTQSLLHRIDIYEEQDLIDYYPFKYNTLEPTDLIEGSVFITGIVETTPITTYIKKSLNKLSFRIETHDKLVNVTIFNRAFMKSNLHRGTVITVLGEYDEHHNSITASNILFKEITSTYIEPVYHTTSGLSSKVISNIIKNYLAMNPSIIDFIPEYLIEKYDFKDKPSSIALVHNPPNTHILDSSIKRLKYEELFRFMFKINYLKTCRKEDLGLKRDLPFEEVEVFLKSLSFTLTIDQESALKDIISDLQAPKRMNRLLLGDVGSGKTIVAVISIYYNTLSGYQSALLVPTEILANQHFTNISKMFLPFGIRVELLKGKTTKKERAKIIKDLKNGDIDLLIGTHAVLEDDVEFKNLGLVITDEQHRFGVKERSTFQNKGTMADILYMSATPIPRTYALTIYGDMDISLIKTKPNGRKIVTTEIMTFKEIKKILNIILEEVKGGHEVYIVCPLIESEEGENTLFDAVSLKKKLDIAFNKKIPIGLLHGRMKPQEKDKAMEDFKNGKTRILVSTTVIEVGVDVPAATLMVIMNAERFGLATMHQLRGRIGRNSLESKCILVSDKPHERLQILSKSSDGFYISEEDFKMRGEGDLFGTRQSGDMVFKLANLKTDAKILATANKDTTDFINDNLSNGFKDYPQYQKIIRELSHLD